MDIGYLELFLCFWLIFFLLQCHLYKRTEDLFYIRANSVVFLKPFTFLKYKTRRYKIILIEKRSDKKKTVIYPIFFSF